MLSHDSGIGDGLGHTFLEILAFLEKNGIWKREKYNKKKNIENWNKLKSLLQKMEDEGLIEERHFGRKLMGRVDYALTSKGFKIVEEKRELMKKKWKLLESQDLAMFPELM